MINEKGKNMKKKAKKSTRKPKARPVVVCTKLRGIFFGYAEDTTGDQIHLKRARNAFYWKCTKGFVELAESGPMSGSKIGARADLDLRDISAVLECTPEAAERWESAQWG